MHQRSLPASLQAPVGSTGVPVWIVVAFVVVLFLVLLLTTRKKKQAIIKTRLG